MLLILLSQIHLPYSVSFIFPRFHLQTVFSFSFSFALMRTSIMPSGEKSPPGLEPGLQIQQHANMLKGPLIREQKQNGRKTKFNIFKKKQLSALSVPLKNCRSASQPQSRGGGDPDKNHSYNPKKKKNTQWSPPPGGKATTQQWSDLGGSLEERTRINRILPPRSKNCSQ